MALPHQALVMVADGKKLLFLRNHGDEQQIDLRIEAHDERQDAMDRDLKTDAPGLSFSSAGSGRDTMEETDFHRQEEDRWIKDAAAEVNRRALSNDFEALVIVTPPRALGVLRKQLHKESEKRVIATINKEMSGRPTPEIEKLVLSETRSEELSEV